MCKSSLRLTCALVGLLASGANQNVLGHPCPGGASDSAVGMALAAFRVRSDGTVEATPIAGGSVGPCQKVRLRMSVSYTTPGASGGTAAAFSGGRMVIHTQSDSFSQDVT